MQYIHHYLVLPILNPSNDYPNHHKFEVLLFKSDRKALAPLSDSLKQQQVLSEVSITLLLASTKHRQNIIIQNDHLPPIWNPLQKTRQRQFLSKHGLWQVVFHNGFDHNCDRTLTFFRQGVPVWSSNFRIYRKTARKGREERHNSIRCTLQQVKS